MRQLSFVEFVFSGTGENSGLVASKYLLGSESQVAKNRSSLASDVLNCRRRQSLLQLQRDWQFNKECLQGATDLESVSPSQIIQEVFVVSL